MFQSVSGSPYLIDDRGGSALDDSLRELDQRVAFLRGACKLNEATLLAYYGEKRFEHVAESNALEGSTLSVGETELAILKGVTLTGHDPGFSRDARNLDRAVNALVDLSRDRSPTDLDQLRTIHELVMGDHPSAGSFRRTEVRIRGSEHAPPRTWRDVMERMEQWEAWSRDHRDAPAALRASILHARLEHVHPFLDGNGRTGRAITNLELIRAGYPPIIIRKKDRDQYLDALRRTDEGDLGAFLDLVLVRLSDALRDLERAAGRGQGYDAQRERARHAQRNRLDVWDAGVDLLRTSVKASLAERLDWATESSIEIKKYNSLDLDDFIDLCEGRPIRLSWSSLIRLRAPGVPMVERLAWTGVPGETLRDALAGKDGRPALRWSVPNPARYPPWLAAGAGLPGGEEMTIVGDRWLVVRDGDVLAMSTSDLAASIAADLAALTVPEARL